MTAVARRNRDELELYHFPCCSARVAPFPATVVHELANSITIRSSSATMASRACAASPAERVGGEPR